MIAIQHQKLCSGVQAICGISRPSLFEHEPDTKNPPTNFGSRAAFKYLVTFQFLVAGTRCHLYRTKLRLV